MEPNATHETVATTPPVVSAAEALEVVNQSVLALWDVVDNLTRLRPPRFKHFYVTIFGSARIQQGTKDYEAVRKLAAELAKLGCYIVTGGGPGLMAAANEGAAEANPGDRGGSIGIGIDLPHEQGKNAFVGQVYQHKTFFSRLHHFVLISDAFVVLPGGVGTTLETMMVWQLLQVRKLYGTPLILIGRMWADLVEWARGHMIDHEPQLADAVDMTIPRCVADAEEAVALLREQHAKWLAQAKQ